jgi:anti-sigma-K factor RskA
MSGSQTPPLNDKTFAFDYVTGVLRGSERDQFEQRLQHNPELQSEVSFWEEQLMNLSEQEEGVKPDPEVWDGIAARIIQNNEKSSPQKTPRFWLWPGVAAFATLLLTICVGLLIARDPLQQPNADYVAVLTDKSGKPQLTVLTATGGEQLWLKWENVQIPVDKNLQLWAISKRDGQIRPLGVFAETDLHSLKISVAQWRLIKDASHLILTEEDVGGSALDEPSELIVAKGVCVLLAQVEKVI